MTVTRISDTINNMVKHPVNLFVYGSLREPSIFESVCGVRFSLKPSEARPEHILRAELAMLAGHRRVSPDNVYFYAVPDNEAKVQGFVIYDVPPAAMKVIDKYEGQFYERETVRVNTANGLVEAQAYLACPASMKKRFGDRFHVNLIHELWLRKRIEKFFDEHTRPGEKTIDAYVERQARRELIGTTERDLVVSHLGHAAVSDFYLENELDRPVPSIHPIVHEPDVQPFIDNYLALVIKQVLLNHFELLIHERFRFELDRLTGSIRYYTRTPSLLIALRMINANPQSVNLILQRGLETMPPGRQYDLIDYVKYAVAAAENAFDPRVAHSNLLWIRNNHQLGLVPMGAELELSNIGFRAIRKDCINKETMFDGFRYFNEFALDELMWKVGGYIDDHLGSHQRTKRGFLELAPGRLSLVGELSRPATADPWVLSQVIRELTAFYPIRPHSLHITFQLRKHKQLTPTVLPLSIIKCLCVLGGGMEESHSGRLWASRLNHHEIERNEYGEELVFARTSKRRYRMPAGDGINTQAKFPVYTHQYKFIRLERRANYEPLIMALKGIQLALNPGDYLTCQQLAASRRLRNEYEELKAWAADPTPISRRSKGRFLDAIYDGLMHEGHHQPYHKAHYIDWALGAIDLQIRLFNKRIEAAQPKLPPMPPVW